jgi:hypothetical protein
VSITRVAAESGGRGWADGGVLGVVVVPDFDITDPLRGELFFSRGRSRSRSRSRSWSWSGVGEAAA